MTTISNVTWLPPASRAAVARVRRPTLVQMVRTVMTRRMLAAMDDRMLADIGISRADAAMEADRLPWDTTAR